MTNANALPIQARLREGAYTKRGADDLIMEAADRIDALEAALREIAESADDDDSWTSDGHERCTDAARAALGEGE